MNDRHVLGRGNQALNVGCRVFPADQTLSALLAQRIFYIDTEIIEDALDLHMTKGDLDGE